MPTYSVPNDITGRGRGEPAQFIWNITASDTEDLRYVTRAIRCGGAGDLAVKTIGGDVVVIPDVVAGEVLVLRATKVYATSTTATGIVGMA